MGIVPINGQDQVYLVKQFRYPPHQTLIEIPAGKLDEGEDPINCARRELKEEVGAENGKLIKLVSFYTTPGFCDELLHMYLALDFKVTDNNLDDDEFLHILKFNLKDSIDMIKNGQIQDAKTIIGLMLARDYVNEKK
ncbi:MAG: NUDIX hydrolase [Actinomycetota bacterium]|nr:NUDIX hydrolase [Actinomycetota bacterium]